MIVLGLINWKEFVCCQVIGNETYSEAKRLFSVRNRDVLTPSPIISGGLLLSLLLFGRVRHCPRLLVGEGLVCVSGGKADLLSDHFDSKQSGESVDLPPTCHPSPSLIRFAFRSSELMRLL